MNTVGYQYEICNHGDWIEVDARTVATEWIDRDKRSTVNLGKMVIPRPGQELGAFYHELKRLLHNAYELGRQQAIEDIRNHKTPCGGL